MNYDGNSTLVDFATGDATLLGATLTDLAITHCDDVTDVTDDDLDDDNNGPATLPSATYESDLDDGPVTLPCERSVTLIGHG